MKKYCMIALLGLFATGVSAAYADTGKSSLPMTMSGGAKPAAGAPANHPAMGTPPDTNMSNSGKILEVITTDQYSYLKVQSKQGPIWLAGYKGNFTKGATVKYSSGLEMKNFESKAAKRMFDSIYFVDSMEQVK